MGEGIRSRIDRGRLEVLGAVAMVAAPACFRLCMLLA